MLAGDTVRKSSCGVENAEDMARDHGGWAEVLSWGHRLIFDIKVGSEFAPRTDFNSIESL